LRRPALIAAGLVATLAIGTAVYTAESARDSDDDGFTDLAERIGWVASDGAVYVTDPFKSDTDGDGLSDLQEAGNRTDADNGTWVYEVVSDPTRIDSDGDSLTDAWETIGWTSHNGQRFHSDPLLPDSDDDGLSDELEAGQLIEQRGSLVVLATFADPLSADSDGDDLSDLEEADLSLNALDSDTDADGLLDHQEVHTLGTAADVADTDGDYFDDHAEVHDNDRGLDPLRVDVKADVAAYATDFAKGYLAGELVPGDSMAWLAGSLTSGASSAVPVVGWAVGGAADLRDIVASSIRADWVSASYSVVGLVPVTGDAVSLALKVTKFLVKHPKLIAEVSRLIVDAEWIAESAKIKAVAATAPQAWDRLGQSSSAHTLLTLAKGGTDLRTLAETLARTSHVEGTPAPFLATSASAEEELQRLVNASERSSRASVTAFPTAGCAEECNAVARTIDVIADGVGHEAQLGYLRLTPSIEKQIRSDAYLVKTGELDGAHWHFFASSQTNSIGASTDVLDLLDHLNIAYTTHLPE